MIRLSQVTLARGAKVLLEAADLAVNPGERVGLVGANGSGKSSLFSLLRGERPPATLDDLTKRELEVLALIAEGRTDRGIAAELYITPKTVEYAEELITAGAT